MSFRDEHLEAAAGCEQLNVCLLQALRLGRPFRSARNQTWWGNQEEQVRTSPLAWRLFSARASLTVSVAVDKLNNLKQKDKLPISKPKVLAATAKPTKQERRQTTTVAPTTAGTRTRPQSLRRRGHASRATPQPEIPTGTFAEIVLSVSPASRQESWEDSELFKPQPSSDVDALGKKRYVGRWTRRPAEPSRDTD